MATALFSGCDFFTSWTTEATDVANTVYAGTNQNGSTGPAAGTKMSFIGRYTYKVTSGELSNILAAGLSVFWFYENSAIQPSFNANYLANTTFAQGRADAQDAQTNLTALGISTSNMPVYFAIDYDAGATQEANITNYFEGIGSVLDQSNIGFYGNVFMWNSLTGNPGSPLQSGVSFFCQSRSSGWNGNGNYATGQNLWQWPPAYSPSGNVTINGHGTDGEFAYTADFGQYPRPSGGGPTPANPQLNFATVTFPTVSFTQPSQQTIALPKNDYDKVIYSTTFTTSVSNTVGSYTVSGPTTNINQSAYPMGNFSYDSGNTWNDFGFIFGPSNGKFDFGSFAGALPAVVIQPIVSTSGAVTFSVAVTQTISGLGASIPLTIHLALLSIPSPSIADSTSVTQPLAYGSVKSSASSGAYGTYRRIYTDSFIPTTGSPTSLNHNQSMVPNILFWNQDNTGDIFINPVRWASTGNIANEFGIKMNSSTITFYVDSSLTRCYFRVYEDN